MDAQFKLHLAQNVSAPERFFASGGASKKKSAATKKPTAAKKTAAKKEEVGIFGKMVKAVGDVAKGAVKMGKKVGETATGAVKGAVKAVGKVGEKAKKAVMPAKKKAAVKSKKSTKSKSMRGGEEELLIFNGGLVKDENEYYTIKDKDLKMKIYTKAIDFFKKSGESLLEINLTPVNSTPVNSTQVNSTQVNSTQTQSKIVINLDRNNKKFSFIIKLGLKTYTFDILNTNKALWNQLMDIFDEEIMSYQLAKEV